jgi:hypothetical protein
VDSLRGCGFAGRIGLVIFQINIVPWLDVLNQSGFEQERIDFGIYRHEIYVGDFRQQPRQPWIKTRLLVKVRTSSVAQILGLAYVDDS